MFTMIYRIETFRYHDSFIPDYVHLHSLMNVVFELGLYPKMLQFYAEFMSS